MAIYHGRATELLAQKESVFRTAPTPAAAYKVKFDTLNIKDDEDYVPDNTLNGSTLAEKRDISDSKFSAQMNSILCLNDIGFWLSLLWGAPATTGAGPFTHTFTLSLAERDSALLDLVYKGNTAIYRRYLGFMLDEISWDVREGDQTMQMNFMGASQVLPNPTAAFDAAPTALAKARACRKGGEIFDVSGGNTLGRVSAGKVNIKNNLEGYTLADGSTGPGIFLLGEPEITGEMTAMMHDGNLMQYAEDHTSRPLTLTVRDNGTSSLALTLPAVEFDKPTQDIPSAKGLIQTVAWRAHNDAVAPTLTLINGVASYV